MNIRTTLPIAAIAAVGMALAGCVAPSTRVTQLQPSQQEKPQLVAPAPPKVQPLPELPEVQLPSERVLGGVETGEWLPGVDLSKILINPTGPEADPYLQHYPPVLVVPAIDEVLDAPAWIEPLMPVGTDAGTNPVNPYGTQPATTQAETYWQQYLPANEPAEALTEEPASIEPLMPIYSDAGTNPVDPWVAEPASIEPLMPVDSDAGTNPVNPYGTQPATTPADPYWQQFLPADEPAEALIEEPASIEPLMPIYSDAGTNPVDPWVVEPASIEPLMPVGTDAGTNPVNPWVEEPAVAPQSLWLPGVDLRTISIAPIGPPSELALAHRESVKPTPWLPGVDLRLVDLTLPGPEADPYLQHRTE
jgi:hypothetical protein